MVSQCQHEAQSLVFKRWKMFGVKLVKLLYVFIFCFYSELHVPQQQRHPKWDRQPDTQ